MKEANHNITKPLGKIITGSWILAGLFSLIGLYLLIIAIQARNWQEINATILTSKVVGHISHRGTNPQNNHISLSRLSYDIQVQYTYKFSDKTYVGNRYSIGTGQSVKGEWADKSEARKWLKQSIYQPNQVIKIYVNPNDPNQSVIYNGIHWGTLVPFVIALLFAGLAYMLIFITKSLKEKNATVSTQNYS